MNPVVGGTLLAPVSLQQPAAVAYTTSLADGTLRNGALNSSVSRFESAMATGPAQHVASAVASSAASALAGPMPGVINVSAAQGVPPTAAPAKAANAVATVSNVPGVQAHSNVSGVQTIQPVERAGSPHGAYNDANGLPRLSDGVAAGDNADAPAAPDAIDPAQATDPAASMGDRILSSLRSVSDGAAHTWSAIGQLAQQTSGNMSMQQMMSFQMGAMQASVQFDYVGKIISRATHNLDQLVKTQ